MICFLQSFARMYQSAIVMKIKVFMRKMFNYLKIIQIVILKSQMNKSKNNKKNKQY